MKTNRYLPALVVALFFYLPYASHFLFPAEGRVPTGFLQYDMSYYAANADAHFDEGFRAMIPNPSSDRLDGPGLYAFPQNHLYGALLRMIPASSGVIWTLLGFGATLVFFVTAFRLLEQTWPELPASRSTGARVLFLMGGGVLFLCGLVVWLRSYAQHPPVSWWWLFDPADGMWFFNLGRNAIYPYEAIYHALFLGAAGALLTRRWVLCGALAALAAWAHPFTGIELLGVLILAKVFDLKSRQIPWSAALFWLGLAGLMVWYYFVFLPADPEHAATAERWKLDWTVEAWTMIPAYALVGVPAGLALWRERGNFTYRTRCLLAWACTVFLLMNHDSFLRAHQPIHFSRGYLWTALFLLGFPLLWSWFQRLKRPVLVFGFGAFFCLDNLVFVADFCIRRAPHEITLSKEEAELREQLRRFMTPKNLLVVSETEAPLATIVLGDGPGRAWISHKFQTPYWREKIAALETYEAGGPTPEAWKGRPLLMVVDEKNHRKPPSYQSLWKGPTLELIKITP